jgi:hypothetical protein
MSEQLQQQIRQLEFEREYAESQCGKLYVQNQHMQQTIERLVAVLAEHRIDPSTGEQSLKMAEDNGEVTEVIERGSVRQSP